MQMPKTATKMFNAGFRKTKLRGWIHLVTAPLTLANTVVLTVLAGSAAHRAGILIYGMAALLLFGISATYHIGNWPPAVKAVLRRADHANIFLLIAGTYTPLSVMLLTPRQAATVLAIVWGGTVAGIFMHIFWIEAPRWLYVTIYIALGWVAVWFLPSFWRNGNPAIVWLLVAGGMCYTVGALFYALRWPNPWPRYFGFHEFFHSGTVAGFACHAVAIWLALFVR